MGSGMSSPRCDGHRLVSALSTRCFPGLLLDPRAGQRSRRRLPATIFGACFSIRVSLVWDCLAPAMFRLYSRCRPGVRASKAAMNAGSPSRRSWSSSTNAGAGAGSISSRASSTSMASMM